MSKKFGVPAKYTFTLNVDTRELDTKIGCVPIVSTFQKIPLNSTNIKEIIPENTFQFFDSNRNTKRWVVTMKDQISNIILDKTNNHKCWWCHQLINGQVYGCPIKFIQEENTSTYFSFIQKKDITLTSKTDSGYYLTAGFFCAWGCLLGYIESKRTDVVYRESIQLFYKMYKEFGNSGTPHASPPYTILEEYGGPLSVEKYKESYCFDTYKQTNNFYVRMIPVGELFEITSKF